MTVVKDSDIRQSRTPVPTGEFLAGLFAGLNTQGVRYCVLWSYEGLPDIVENDVDLLVHRQDARAFRECLLSVARDKGWALIKHPSRFGFESFWFVGASGQRFIQIDVWTIVHWRSIPWVDADRILSKRTHVKGFFVPAAAAEAGMLLVKDIIRSGKIKAKYRDRIRAVAEANREGLRELLSCSVGRAMADWLAQEVQEGRWERIEQRTARIRLLVIRQALGRHPAGMLFNAIRFLGGHLRARLTKPSGAFVVLMGPDGSGKSTVAEALAESLRPAFRHRRYYHGRFGILPRLRDVKDRVFGVQRGEEPEPLDDAQGCCGGDSRLGRGRILVYLLYYSLDYLLGHRVVGRAEAIGDLVIFDRYFYDWFVQASYERTPRWLLPVFRAMFPRPDLLIHLCNDPHTVHSRKPELTVAQIEEQNRRCGEIVAALPYATTVLTDASVDQIVAQIREEVVAVMKSRFQVRRA